MHRQSGRERGVRATGLGAWSTRGVVRQRRANRASRGSSRADHGRPPAELVTHDGGVDA